MLTSHWAGPTWSGLGGSRSYLRALGVPGTARYNMGYFNISIPFGDVTGGTPCQRWDPPGASQSWWDPLPPPGGAGGHSFGGIAPEVCGKQDTCVSTFL